MTNSIPLEDLLSFPTIPANVPSFTVIRSCEFSTEELKEADDYASEAAEEVFPCECRPSNTLPSEAQCCGAQAKCINRELFIECPAGECPSDDRCQNQRFSRREYAKVKVVETPGKGFGLFTCEDLKPGSFVMEYVGEIVDKDEMADRSAAYAASGPRHFYFMTLRSDRIIDATRKGNISRFMNHSCAPNCETQKWIVEGRLRIGLFAVKPIKAGSELCFDYKFVRYGKEPQKCLCGEECCTGFIGVSEVPNKRRAGRKEADLEGELIAAGALEDPDDAECLVQLLKQEDLKDLPALLGVIAATATDSLSLRKFMSLHGLKLLAHCAKGSSDAVVIEACLKALAVLPIGSVNSVEEAGWMDLLDDLQQYPLAVTLKAKFSALQRVFKIPRKQATASEAEEEAGSTVTPAVMAVPEAFSQAIQQRKRGRDASDRDRDTRDARDRDERGRDTRDYRDNRYHSRSDDRLDRYRDNRDSRDNRDRDSRDNRDSRESRERDYSRDYRDNRDNRDRRDYRDQRDNRDSRDYRSTSKLANSNSASTPTSSTATSQMIPDPNWLEATTEGGERYYYHRETRETSWTLPMIPASQGARNTLLEGVQDDQLAAIINRAKARRTQESTAEQATTASSNDQLDIFSLISASASSPSKHSSTTSHQPSKKMKEEISEVVVKFLSHYKSHLGDDFKDAARRYTHRIVEKELAAGEAFEMTSRKRAKIKAYLAEAMRGRKIPLLPEHEILLK